MGTGHSIDTPIRVAHLGISSVMSLVDDLLLDYIGLYYSEKYSLPFESNVSIVVYNILGEEVTKLVENNKPAGIHKIHFNGTGLSSGIYLYSIRATSIENNKNFLKVKKMVLIK